MHITIIIQGWSTTRNQSLCSKIHWTWKDISCKCDHAICTNHLHNIWHGHWQKNYWLGICQNCKDLCLTLTLGKSCGTHSQWRKYATLCITMLFGWTHEIHQNSHHWGDCKRSKLSPLRWLHQNWPRSEFFETLYPSAFAFGWIFAFAWWSLWCWNSKNSNRSSTRRSSQRVEPMNILA